MKRYRKNVDKRKDGRYEGRYIIRYENVYGKAVYHSVYAKTYKEIILKLEEAENKVFEEVQLQRLLRKEKEKSNQRGIIENVLNLQFDENQKDKAKTLLAEWLRKWLESYKKYTIKQSSYTRYSNVVNRHLVPRLGHCELENLKPDAIQDYIKATLEENKIAVSTVRGHIVILSAALKQAQKEGLIHKNPCDDIILPKRPIKKPVFLDVKEAQKLEIVLKNSRDHKKSTAVLFALKTGIRLGELAALRWKDVDFDEQVIQIRDSVQRVKNSEKSGMKTKMVFEGTKSYSSNRTIPMNPEIHELLYQYYETMKHRENFSETFVFTNRKNSFIDPRVYQLYFRRILKKAGIRHVNFHALRHTFATHAASKNMQISVLSRILGHSNVGLTLQLYVHVLSGQDQQEMLKLSAS